MGEKENDRPLKSYLLLPLQILLLIIIVIIIIIILIRDY